MEIVVFASFGNNNQVLIEKSLFLFWQQTLNRSKKGVYICLDFLTRVDYYRGCMTDPLKDLTQYMIKYDNLPIADFLMQNFKGSKGYFLLPHFNLKTIMTIFALVSIESRTAILIDKIENILKQLDELSFELVVLVLPAGYNAFLSLLETKYIIKLDRYEFLSQIRLEFVEDSFWNREEKAIAEEYRKRCCLKK